MAESSKYLQEHLVLDSGHLLDQVLKKIWCWTMVIYWSRFRKEVVFSGREQLTRNLGLYRGKDAGGIR